MPTRSLLILLLLVILDNSNPIQNTSYKCPKLLINCLGNL